MSDKPQVVNPADLHSAGNRMAAQMDEQGKCFQRIVAIAEQLVASGMRSEAGGAFIRKLQEISHGAAMQRARSEEVVANMQSYAGRTSASSDKTKSSFESVQ